MRISIPTKIDLDSISTSVTDDTRPFDNTDYIEVYAENFEYQHDGSIFRNGGDTYRVPLWTAVGVYTLGQIVYKDSYITKVATGVVPKQPSEYGTRVDAGYDHTQWSWRYSKLQDIPYTLTDGEGYYIENSNIQGKFAGAGMYFYTVKAGQFTETRQMIVQ